MRRSFHVLLACACLALVVAAAPHAAPAPSPSPSPTPPPVAAQPVVLIYPFDTTGSSSPTSARTSRKSSPSR